jgi:tRNA uridine 5-carboxymethylaminomethyl modification enzyme
LFTTKRNQIIEERRRLETTRIGRDTLAQMLRRPEITYDHLPDRNKSLPTAVKESVEIEIKYEGYINRQIIDVERTVKTNSKIVPSNFDYLSVIGLSREAKQKLATIRPLTLGQASRISGVSPADIGLLAVWIKRFPTSGNDQPLTGECISGSNNPSQGAEQ